MKVRSGFVSNSSSSSFICEVCGEAESSWDGALSDVGMTECVNGHIFHEHELIKTSKEEILKSLMEKAEKYLLNKTGRKKELNSLLKEIDSESKDDQIESLLEFFNEDYGHPVSPAECPICSFQAIPDYMIWSYIKKTLGKSSVDFANEMKLKFNNSDEFWDFIGKKKDK